MYVQELWRYPVKSLAGEPLEMVRVQPDGLLWDREVVVLNEQGRITTSRTKPKLLGLKGSTNAQGDVFINGFPWDSAEALEVVRAAAGPEVQLVRFPDIRRFDVLPLSIATSGAVAYMRVDRRRFRPNILLGGVEGLAERRWAGRGLRIGEVEIRLAHLRARCVMTTYDPDTQVQDLGVLRRIVHELDGTFSLDSEVVTPGEIRVGDPVELM